VDVHRREVAIVAATLALAGCGGAREQETQSIATAPQPTVVVAPEPEETLVAFADSPEAPKALAALADAPVVLNERITDRFAIVVLARGPRAFAAALGRTGGRWHVLLGDAVRLHSIRPHPGERVRRRTQVAAGVAANTPILQAGLWVDGRALPANGGGFDRRHLTMWQEAPQPLRHGHHVVVAYASTEADASALAWTFVVR
jgi:hypothetical protein